MFVIGFDFPSTVNTEVAPSSKKQKKRRWSEIIRERWDKERVSYHDRPGMFWNPENFVLNVYRVGEPRFTIDEVSVQDM